MQSRLVVHEAAAQQSAKVSHFASSGRGREGSGLRPWKSIISKDLTGRVVFVLLVLIYSSTTVAAPLVYLDLHVV